MDMTQTPNDNLGRLMQILYWKEEVRKLLGGSNATIFADAEAKIDDIERNLHEANRVVKAAEELLVDDGYFQIQRMGVHYVCELFFDTDQVSVDKGSLADALRDG